jgi:hypothetical protein
MLCPAPPLPHTYAYQILSLVLTLPIERLPVQGKALTGRLSQQAAAEATPNQAPLPFTHATLGLPPTHKNYWQGGCNRGLRAHLTREGHRQHCLDCRQLLQPGHIQPTSMHQHHHKGETRGTPGQGLDQIRLAAWQGQAQAVCASQQNTANKTLAPHSEICVQQRRAA